MERDYNPAQSCVTINQLSHKLQEVMAAAGSTDRQQLMEITTKIREQAGAIRTWAINQHH